MPSANPIPAGLKYRAVGFAVVTWPCSPPKRAVANPEAALSLVARVRVSVRAADIAAAGLIGWGMEGVQGRGRISDGWQGAIEIESAGRAPPRQGKAARASAHVASSG